MHFLRIVCTGLKRTALVIATLCLATGYNTAVAADGPTKNPPARMTINAGTAFNLSPVFDTAGNPVFPWLHEVRGVVQVSNLGNAIGQFDIRIDAGSACDGGYAFCLSGKMKITTLAGDVLNADVVGWADPDPNDMSPTPSMYLLHYDVTITGGTGKLQGASGRGEINGAFNFCGANCFCDSYAGVATWLYDGVLHLPRR